MASFENFQLQAYLNTEDEMKKIYAIMAEDYAMTATQISKTMKDYYGKYLLGIPKDQYYNVMLKYSRLDNMLQEIEAQFLKTYNKAGRDIGNAGEVAVSNGFYRNLYTLTFLDGPVDLSFSLINPYLVEASVYGSIDAWKKINTDAFKGKFGEPSKYMREGTLSDLLAKNKTKSIQEIRRAVSTNLLQGNSYQDAARDIRKIVGTKQIVDGKTVYTGSMADSLKIARTEGNRTLNLANYASTEYTRSQGLEMQRQWIATLDGKVRSSHLQADRQLEDVDGYFYIGGERMPYPSGGSASNSINCRCTTINVIDGVEPSIRRGIDPTTGKSEVFSMKNYDSWMKSKGFKQDTKGLYVKK